MKALSVKPRIFYCRNREAWYCSGPGILGIGKTPQQAFTNWLDKHLGIA